MSKLGLRAKGEGNVKKPTSWAKGGGGGGGGSRPQDR